jgi:hypothetical protein
MGTRRRKRGREKKTEKGRTVGIYRRERERERKRKRRQRKCE